MSRRLRKEDRTTAGWIEMQRQVFPVSAAAGCIGCPFKPETFIRRLIINLCNHIPDYKNLGRVFFNAKRAAAGLSVCFGLLIGEEIINRIIPKETATVSDDGPAAALCSVLRNTVLGWIQSGQLSSQRNAGQNSRGPGAHERPGSDEQSARRRTRRGRRGPLCPAQPARN
jgi:hypothetical protein